MQADYYRQEDRSGVRRFTLPRNTLEQFLSELNETHRLMAKDSDASRWCLLQFMSVRLILWGTMSESSSVSLFFFCLSTWLCLCVGHVLLSSHFLVSLYNTPLFRPWPFLNMHSCLYFWSCGLVKHHQSLPKYCSNSKFTSTIAKSSSNPWMCSWSAPFTKDASRGDMCRLETARYPRMQGRAQKFWGAVALTWKKGSNLDWMKN